MTRQDAYKQYQWALECAEGLLPLVADEPTRPNIVFGVLIRKNKASRYTLKQFMHNIICDGNR